MPPQLPEGFSIGMNEPDYWTIDPTIMHIEFGIKYKGETLIEKGFTFPSKPVFSAALGEMRDLIEDEYSHDFCVETFRLLIKGEL